MKQFTDWMHALSGALMVIGQTIISAFGVIVILVFVVIVEIQRVAHGVQLFEESGAYTGAAVLVLLLLTLEFIVHYVETKENYQHEQQNAFSLRQFREWLKYFIGFGQHYIARPLSPAQRIKSYSQLLTLTILALALAGSMDTAISQVQGTWIEGLQAILFQSSLAEIVEWVAGVLFALTLVIGSQRITAYVAQRAAETLEQSDKSDKTISTPETDSDNEIVMQNFEPEVVETNEPALDEIIIAEWIQNDAKRYTETCEDCGWSSESKDSEESAIRALRMHQARYCPIVLDEIPETAKAGQNGHIN